MTRIATAEDWLEGPGDLREKTIEVVLSPGSEPLKVRVQGLAASFSNQATSEALEMTTGPRGDQMAKVNTDKLEVLQFAHGCVEPEFTVPQAETIARKYGPAFKSVVEAIDSLSGVDKEAIERAEATFPSVGKGASGADLGDATRPRDGGSGVRVRTGAGVGNDSD